MAVSARECTAMLVMVILTVFIAGLMVGRTPEYLGKKIESYDVQMAMLYVLIFPLIILGFTAVSVACAGIRTDFSRQSGRARPFGDPVCVYLRHGQQRLGICGFKR